MPVLQPLLVAAVEHGSYFRDHDWSFGHLVINSRLALDATLQKKSSWLYPGIEPRDFECQNIRSNIIRMNILKYTYKILSIFMNFVFSFYWF